MTELEKTLINEITKKEDEINELLRQASESGLDVTISEVTLNKKTEKKAGTTRVSDTLGIDYKGLKISITTKPKTLK